MMGVLDGKVALITGGSSGVGLEAARQFAAEGARVVIVGRSTARGAQAERALRAGGAEAIFVAADISIEADVSRMVQMVMARYGRIDVSFLNAGISGSGARIAEMTEAQFDHSIANNLKGPFLCLKYLIPILPSPGGAVVFTSSIASTHGSAGRAEYAAAKGGLNAFARAAAMELAPSGIRVNVVVPAGILTPMSIAYAERVADRFGGKEAAIAAMHGLHPLGRMAEAADVARTALFLASDAAAMITGQLLCVDGGLSTLQPGNV